MAEPKIFTITEASGKQRLIQAKNAQAAIQHAIGAQYTCKQAKTTDIVALMTAGIVVEVAVDEKASTKAAAQIPAPETHGDAAQVSTQQKTAGIL